VAAGRPTAPLRLQPLVELGGDEADRPVISAQPAVRQAAIGDGLMGCYTVCDITHRSVALSGSPKSRKPLN